MLNRRFLRVKVLQEIYSYHQSDSSDLPKAEKSLLQNIDELYKLFIYQLSFWVEVKRFAERRIEENRNKNFPTPEDLNPNLKFVNNRILNALDDNKHLMALEEKYHINWADAREDFIRSFYNRMLKYPEYQVYMTNDQDSFSNDKRFINSVIENYMAEDWSLYDYYCDADLTFNSDYQVAIYLLWKFIGEMKEDFGPDSPLPPVYKAEVDDKEFVVKLFEKTILNADKFVDMVKSNSPNWDYERFALIDKIIIFMALTEFCDFSTIPVKVTINEYIEISKLYSTPESRRFVNGMLDRLSKILIDDGTLLRMGKGL